MKCESLDGWLIRDGTFPNPEETTLKYFCINHADKRLGTVFIRHWSDSDVYRRRILTYKGGPRAERVNCEMCGIWARYPPCCRKDAIQDAY